MRRLLFLACAVILSPCAVRAAHGVAYFSGDPIPPRTAYLTFDDGPSSWTAEVLDVLTTADVRATFFVSARWGCAASDSGNKFLLHRSVLLRMIDSGHAIGNHSWGHKYFSSMAPSRIQWHLEENQRALNDALGSVAPQMTLIRPPYGSPWFGTGGGTPVDAAARAVADYGVLCLWTREADTKDSRSWAAGDWHLPAKRLNPNHPEFARRVRETVDRATAAADGRGLILLLHDTHYTTVRALPLIIQILRHRGYRFDTMENYVRWRWGESSRDIAVRQRLHRKTHSSLSSTPAKRPTGF